MEHESDWAEDLVTESTIICPYCSEENTILHDPSGGAIQEYVEDCQVCCLPWQVRVSFSETGVPTVEVVSIE